MTRAAEPRYRDPDDPFAGPALPEFLQQLAALIPEPTGTCLGIDGGATARRMGLAELDREPEAGS